MRHVACDLCGGNDTQFLFYGLDRIHGRNRDWRVVKCRRCDLMYLDPQPEPAELATFYPDDYYAFHSAPVSGLRRRIQERLTARWRGKADTSGWESWLAGIFRHHLSQPGPGAARPMLHP